MSSKIIFLGTAGDIATIQKHRSSSGIVLEMDDVQAIIDPGIASYLRSAQLNIQIKDTKIFLISNNDILYTNDINAFLQSANEPYLLCPEHFMNHNHSVLTSDSAKRAKHVENVVYRNIEITKIPSKDELSFLIKTPKYILSYLTFLPKDYDFLRDCNIMIIKMQKDTAQLIKIIEAINPELVILTGFTSQDIQDDPLETSRNIKKRLQKDKQYRTQVLPAKEGMSINPEAYNVRLKQKSLHGFLE